MIMVAVAFAVLLLCKCNVVRVHQLMTYDILTQLAAPTLNPMGNLQRSMASAPEPKRFQARPQHLDSKAASSKKGS